MVGLGEDHTFRVGLGHIGEGAQQLVVVAHHLTQVVGVALPIGDRLARDTRLDSGFRHGARDTSQQARIQRLRQDVVTTEGGAFQLVSRIHHIGHWLFG